MNHGTTGKVEILRILLGDQRAVKILVVGKSYSNILSRIGEIRDFVYLAFENRSE